MHKNPGWPRPEEAAMVHTINYLWEIDDPWQRIDKRESLPVDQVLIDPFSQGRLDDCLALSRAGKRMPPIDCQRINVGPWTFYTVNDGQHRTLARRVLGKPTVPAIVKSELTINPDWLELRFDGLFRRVSANLMRLVEWKDKMPSDRWDALVWLVEQAKLPRQLGPTITGRLMFDGSSNTNGHAVCMVCGKPLYGDLFYNFTPRGGHKTCYEEAENDGGLPVTIYLSGVAL